MTDPTIRLDGNTVEVRLPVSECHSLEVALAPCPCRAAKSNTTASIRQRLREALARARSQHEQKGRRP